MSIGTPLPTWHPNPRRVAHRPCGKRAWQLIVTKREAPCMACRVTRMTCLHEIIHGLYTAHRMACAIRTRCCFTVMHRLATRGVLDGVRGAGVAAASEGRWQGRRRGKRGESGEAEGGAWRQGAGGSAAIVLTLLGAVHTAGGEFGGRPKASAEVGAARIVERHILLK